MGNNLTPYTIAIGDEYIYFLTPHFNIIKREMIISNEILNTNEKNVDPFDLHVSRCGKNSFKKVKVHKFHSNFNQSNKHTFLSKTPNSNNAPTIFEKTISKP